MPQDRKSPPGSRARSRQAPSDSRTDVLRVPPNSIEAEQAVLGGIMLVPDAYDLVADLVHETDFYRRDHQLIYQAIKVLAEKNSPYDAVTIGEWFESQGMAEQFESGAYLVHLASTTPSAANIEAYARIVRDKAILRQMIEVGSAVVNDGFNTQGRDTEEILSDAEQQILAIGETGNRGRKSYQLMSPVLQNVFDVVQERFANKGQLSGIATGHYEFDAMTRGLQPTDLIILAARPSMGKTTLALNWAANAAVKLKKAVAIFSMEMSAGQVGFKLLASEGRIDATRLSSGELEDEDWGRLSQAFRVLRDAKLLIDDEGSLSPEVLRARARRMKREHDIGLIVVDYLQLMKVPGSTENRATEISEISRQLKALAKELKVPVVALSQLNRSLETRSDKRPVMADLRESGAIEQDADLIVFIYRDEYYNKDSQDKGLAEVIIAKHRTGPTGSLKLRFFGNYSQFTNLARDPLDAF